MIKTYPFQALLALAGLGLLIGLPSMDGVRKTTPLLSQARVGTCFTDPSHTQNESKTDLQAEAAQRVDNAYAPRNAISNTPVAGEVLLSNKMRQTLRQCV